MTALNRFFAPISVEALPKKLFKTENGLVRLSNNCDCVGQGDPCITGKIDTRLRGRVRCREVCRGTLEIHWRFRGNSQFEHSAV
jgi:hypothetical protein